MKKIINTILCLLGIHKYKQWSKPTYKRYHYEHRIYMRKCARPIITRTQYCDHFQIKFSPNWNDEGRINARSELVSEEAERRKKLYLDGE